MEINEQTMRMIIMFLFKIEEYKACEELLQVYKKQFVPQAKANLKLVPRIDMNTEM